MGPAVGRFLRKQFADALAASVSGWDAAERTASGAVLAQQG